MQNDKSKKNIVQDVMPSKKSIRNIELPSRRRSQTEPLVKREPPIVDNFVKTVKISRPDVVLPIATKRSQPLQQPVSDIKSSPRFEQKVVEEHVPSYQYVYDEPVKKSKKTIYITAGVFIIALAFGISALFKSSKITITPKHQTFTLDSQFNAEKDSSGNGLSFQIVTINEDLQKTVPALAEKKVDTKATGTIVIFNTNTTSQKLIATTRFQTPEGLVFRLISPVTIPASKIVIGKTVAGSIEAKVEADTTGVNYNIGLKDFVLPALKGTAKYTQVYARSKTVMGGGFSGMQKVVASDVITTTDTELESSLKTKLATDIVSQIPANFVLYGDALTYSFSDTIQAGSDETGAILQKKGTAYAVIFDKGILTRAIISNLMPDGTNDIIKIPNIDKLTFSYPDGSTFNPASGDSTLNFKLSGSVNFVWVIDENKLKSDLLGLSKVQAREIISKNTSITESWLETKPFWNQTIPNDPKKVTLINTLAN